MKRKTKKRTSKKPVRKVAEPSSKPRLCKMPKCSGSGSSAIYGLGFIGAVVYYISTATGFWNGVLGILKAVVWPAFLVFESLKFLGM